MPKRRARREQLFRRRAPLPLGWEYELPEGKVATPIQSAEYRRRRRRAAIHTLVIFLGVSPGAIWLSMLFAHRPVMLIACCITLAIVCTVLHMASASSFRCPVCEMRIEEDGRMRRSDLSPERRAALYGKYRWCDNCGTRFEICPRAICSSSPAAARQR